jgi:hypothetical protein
MNLSRYKNNSALVYLFLIILTIGIKFPIEGLFSSLSVFIMIIAFIHLLLDMFFLKIKFNKRFLITNAYLSFIILFFTLVAMLNGKYFYKPYPFIILFFQWTFFIILSRVKNTQIIKTFIIFLLVNFVFYLIQVFGAIVDNPSITKLQFLGADKAGIEFFTFLPRASGLINEPSHLSYIIFPLCIIVLYQKKDSYIKKHTKYFLFLFYFLTFSLISYAQFITVYLGKAYKQSKIKTILVSMIVFVFLVLMADINIFSGRIAGINDLVSGEQTKESSILSIQSNFLVMLESLKLNPFFGGGLTSHRATYDYFIGSIFPDFTEGGFLGLNQNDGSSLYILLLSETGLIGFLLFLYFVFKAIIKFRNNLENKLIGFAFAISLLFVGLRFGNIATFYIMFYVLVILKEYSISEKPAIKTTQNIKNESL